MSTPSGKKRVFSGIQPSGEMHLGNYLGAIKNWVEAQHDNDNVFCIVDLHAITVPQDPKELHRRSRELAMIYVAAAVIHSPPPIVSPRASARND